MIAETITLFLSFIFFGGKARSKIENIPKLFNQSHPSGEQLPCLRQRWMCEQLHFFDVNQVSGFSTILP